jgi:hypothetical protein
MYAASTANNCLLGGVLSGSVVSSFVRDASFLFSDDRVLLLLHNERKITKKQRAK